MKYTVLTLFPQLIRPWTTEALLGRAAEHGLVSFDVRDLRDYADNRHRRVDDTPYGGGAGMVIRVDVLGRALADLDDPPDETLLLTPAGEPFTQALAEVLAQTSHLCLIAGRYEGFDARSETLVTREVSVGDYVMMGGEVAALAIIEATARLLPGVLGDADSHANDSFSTGLLDYPEYTRPPEYEGLAVPDILLSGHHAKVAAWRREQALTRTLARRPELLEPLPLDDTDRAVLARLKTLDKNEPS